MRVRARRIRLHPGYDDVTLEHDVAVIQLGQDLPYGLVRPAVPGDLGLYPAGTMATTIGWGDTDIARDNQDYPLHLREVEVPIVSDVDCATAYPVGLFPGMVCAGDLVDGGEDSCYGDSGGPLLVPEGPDWVQMGIVSTGTDCARRRFPGIYTEVAAYAFVQRYLDPDSVPDPVARAPPARRLRRRVPRLERPVLRRRYRHRALPRRPPGPRPVTVRAREPDQCGPARSAHWPAPGPGPGGQRGRPEHGTRAVPHRLILAAARTSIDLPGMLSEMTGRSRLLLAPLLVLAALLPAAAASGEATPAAAPSDDTEIVGGQPAGPDEYPFQVALLRRGVSNRYQAQFCGGSLISPDTVLTAAHCLEGMTAGQIDVLVGTHTLAPGGGGARLPVRRIRSHPGFNPDTYANDVGIIQLGVERGEELIPTVQAGQNGLWDPGTPATVIGWGNRSANGSDFPFLLHEVEVPILSNAECATQYGNQYVATKMLCAGDLVNGGEDSCQGDSGGPFFVPDGGSGWVQAGVVSWGILCARRQFPGVYTRLANYTAFINPYLDPDSAPNPVTNVRAQRVSANSFRITWRSPVFDGGAAITRYRVAVPSLGRDHGVLGHQTSFRLQSLPRGPRRIEVRAVNAAGTSTVKAIIINV